MNKPTQRNQTICNGWNSSVRNFWIVSTIDQRKKPMEIRIIPLILSFFKDFNCNKTLILSEN